MNHLEYRDLLTQKHTAFRSFAALIQAQGGYYPSLRTISGCPLGENSAELAELADAYDAAQQIHGDSRRACRS